MTGEQISLNNLLIGEGGPSGATAVSEVSVVNEVNEVSGAIAH